MLLAHKVQLYPTPDQADYLDRAMKLRPSVHALHTLMTPKKKAKV